MLWLQLELTLDADKAERIETALLVAGALSVTFSDAADHPLYEPDPLHPPLWPHTQLSALFSPDVDADAVRAVLAAALGRLPPHRFTPLAARDWEREWLRDFKPMRFGQRLWVVPSAYTPPDPTAINLRLDPGLAFGTGTHASTALCLEWLDTAALAGKSVLDYGCGSGILAIAAARLGAARVHAVDNDPQALTATRENACRNRVDAQIEIGPPENLPAAPVDVVLANVLAAPLIELAPRFAAGVKAGGKLVLSGILSDQDREVHAAYAPWFRFGPGAQREGWLRLDAQRKPESH
ncbi:MAG TPA: 50S ribosomal protein L11 methyltransferase [Gammaproteobacteria bacterium]|nr:50S ribosomal protein L11 methyltransferase [Gammaproteobacteria bacterium]